MPEVFLQSVRRWVAVTVTIAAAAWLCYGGVKHALAAYYGGSPDASDWERAARVEPGNPELWYRLGRDRQLNFDHADLPAAISDYRRAVQLNPRSPYHKLDLASALEMSGSNAEADTYFRAAQQDYPVSAEIAWRYGNFLLRQQRMAEAYTQIHRALVTDPKLIPLGVSRAWHSDPDVHVLLDRVLPGTATGDWDALSFLADSKESSAALTIWNRLIERKPAMEWKTLFAFTDVLVSQGRFDDAASVWRQANAAAGVSSSAENGGSLIFDGGFEQDLSNGGFGWQEVDVPGADFDFDTDEKHSGARSARVVFDGTQNLNYQNLFQLVIVSPATHYRFQGYLHTDQILTDKGVCFEILDPKDVKNLDVLTSNETGSIPWTLEQADFTTGPNTHIVRVQLSRKPSEHFDNKVRGTAWVDDVAILPDGSRQ
jgi:tetratricopeptide (TPR) repeat protein